jgi:hypothetical protein
MKTFEGGELKISVSISSANIKLNWLGRSIGREPSQLLRPFFEALDPYIIRTRDLEIDFRNFEFMNSSTIKPILTFVQNASKSARAVSVKYDATKPWQRLSFGLLRAVARTWENVTVEG